MKTVYVYLSVTCYTIDHINYMREMLTALVEAERAEILECVYRKDVGAYQMRIEATPWMVKFLKHLDSCDMLWCKTDGPAPYKK